MTTHVAPDQPSILYLSKSDIIKLGGDAPSMYVQAITAALALHAQRDFVQPLKPYLRWRGEQGHIADRIIAMPAYLGGDNPIAGIKWVGSKHDNGTRYGLERASAITILNDPETHYPIAIMEGGLISAMRTAAVTAVAAAHLAKVGFQTVACIGCGPIAIMQMRTLVHQFPSIEAVHLYDLNAAAAERLAQTIAEVAPRISFHIESNPQAAVRAGEVVVTCTTADRAYIPFGWFQPGTFISNISLMDIEAEAYLQVDKVVVDDWDQCNREKKIINQLVLEGRFSREKLHAELGELVIGKRPGRESEEEIILFNPMGMAIEDVACAQAIYEKARLAEVGTRLSLF